MLRARNDRAPFLIDDFKAAARDKLGKRLGELGEVRSFATMALFHEDEWIGNLNLVRHEVRPFEAKQAPILQAFADQAAIAVANARLFQRLEEQTRIAEEAGSTVCNTSVALPAVPTANRYSPGRTRAGVKLSV